MCCVTGRRRRDETKNEITFFHQSPANIRWILQSSMLSEPCCQHRGCTWHSPTFQTSETVSKEDPKLVQFTVMRMLWVKASCLMLVVQRIAPPCVSWWGHPEGRRSDSDDLQAASPLQSVEDPTEARRSPPAEGARAPCGSWPHGRSSLT